MAYSPVSSVSTITKLVVLPAPETAKKSCKAVQNASGNSHSGSAFQMASWHRTCLLPSSQGRSADMVAVLQSGERLYSVHVACI